MKNYKQVLSKVKTFVKNELKEESSGHSYWHNQRVANLAVMIGKKEKANLEVLELAGWLHDVGVKEGRKDHEIRGAKMAKQILESLNVESFIVKQVVECVKNHRYSTGKARNLETRIIQDADRLDVMGAIGVARIFAFSGRYKQMFHDGEIRSDPKKYIKTGFSRTIIEHFYDKIFLLPNLLHTNTAKKMGQARIKFAKQFVKQFLLEWEER